MRDRVSQDEVLMPLRKLTAREEEIVGFCVDGVANDEIARQLGLDLDSLGRYLLRIKMKVGRAGKPDDVVNIIKDRAELALRNENVERKRLAEMLAEKEKGVLELKAALALLYMATEQIKSTVWSTDVELRINLIANGAIPSTHFGVKWEVGKTVYEIFKSDDPLNPAVSAHLRALEGESTETRLSGEFSKMLLRVTPLEDEAGEVIGCISILNIVGESP